LDNIKARLKQTSESWIACIFLVLNLVNLARQAFLCLFRSFSASASSMKKKMDNFIESILFCNFQIILKIRVC